MDFNIAVGYVLLVIGVAIILFALDSGLAIYNKVSAAVSYSVAPPSQQGASAANSSLNSTISSLSSLGPELKQIEATGQNDALIYAEVIALYLVASIGYKFCSIGVQMINKVGTVPPQSRKKDEE